MSADQERIERAAETLELEASDVPLFDAVIRRLEEQKDWKKVDRAYRAMLRVVNAGSNVEVEKDLWRRLALVYQYRLDAIDSAILAFEMHAKFGPDHGAFLSLGNAYEAAKRFADASVAYESAARLQPLDPDAYNRCFEMHRERDDLEATFRAAQSLAVLRAPIEDVGEMMFQRLPTRLPELRPLARPDWKDLWHPTEDHLVSNILRFVEAPSRPRAPMVRDEVLRFAARMLGSERATGGPEIAAGADLEKVTDKRLLREELFVAGREAAALVWSHYDHVRSSGAEIASALYGAIRVVRPSVAIPPDLAGAFVVAASMNLSLTPTERDRLTKVVDLFLAQGGVADLARWQRAIRLTRLQAGVLVAGGVGGIRAQLASDDDELTGDVKLAFAASFNVSSAHGTLREKVGWALRGTPKPTPTPTPKNEVEEEEPPSSSEIPDAAITWVTAHPDGRWIAVAEFAGRVLVWAPGENRIVAQQKLGGRVLRVDWTFDGARLVAIAEDTDALHVFSADGADVERTIPTGHGSVLGLAVHPSKAFAATTGLDGHVRVWDLEKGTAVAELKASGEGSVCAFSEELVAVGTRRGEFDVWVLATKKDKAGGEIFPRTYVSAMAFSPDGTSLVMGGGSGKLVHFDASSKTWTCSKEWRDVPPKPIATNDIRFATDGKRWIAAHSDDRASLFLLPADPYPSSLGQAFWIEKKPWKRDFIVSAACFVPGTKAIVTAHFSGRLRIFAERMDQWLRIGDVVFDPSTGAPSTVGPLGDLFARTPPAPVKPKEPVAIAIGDREHRARTVEEMQFAASLHPCATCGAAPKGLVVSGEKEERALRGACPFCATPAAFTFFVEGDPTKSWPRRHEVGDDRASTMIEPRALTSELERLREVGIDDTNRDRALTCIVELLKFVLIRDGERGDDLRAERDRLHADVKPDAPKVEVKGPPPAVNIDTMARALFMSDPPTSVGALERALGIRVEVDVKAFWPERKTDVSLPGFVKKLAFEPIWDIHHQPGPKDAEDLRGFPLAFWSAHFAGGAEVFQNALRRASGAPRVMKACHVYGQHWVVQTRGDEILLTWGQRIPDWAMPLDVAVRERALVDLARGASGSRDELAKVLSSLPPEAGILSRESSPNGISLEFAPAMGVIELARIFGWPEVAARSHDMHGWNHFVHVPGAQEGVSVPPRLGRWAVDLSVLGRVNGEIIGPKDRPFFLSLRRFGPQDRIRYWRLHGA